MLAAGPAALLRGLAGLLNESHTNGILQWPKFARELAQYNNAYIYMYIVLYGIYNGLNMVHGVGVRPRARGPCSHMQAARLMLLRGSRGCAASSKPDSGVAIS